MTSLRSSAEVCSLIRSARATAATAVNTLQVLTNFEIGRRIVEHEQKGEKRAGYGQELLKTLSSRLTKELGKGFSERNLEYMRKFFLLWRERLPEISQTPSAKLTDAIIVQTASGELAPAEIAQKASAQFGKPFALSWSHYVLLLTIKDPGERSFYEIEAARGGWSVPEFKRQVASSLYERLALSRKKQDVAGLPRKARLSPSPRTS